MNQILNEALKWLISPETIVVLVGFICTIPQYIDKFKKAKGQNVQEKAKDFFLEVSKELVNENLSSEEKRVELIKRVYAKIPNKEKKYLSEENAAILANGIYHTFVKPTVTQKNDIIDSSNSDNISKSEAT